MQQANHYTTASPQLQWSPFNTSNDDDDDVDDDGDDDDDDNDDIVDKMMMVLMMVMIMMMMMMMLMMMTTQFTCGSSPNIWVYVGLSNMKTLEMSNMKITISILKK